MFQPQERRREDLYIDEYRMSKTINEFTLLLEQLDTFRVNTMHKKKANKVQLVNLGKLDSNKLGRIQN